MALKSGKIIIFNNKELPFISGRTMWSNRHKISVFSYFWRKFEISCTSYFFKRELQRLRANGYVFGCHWGWTLNKSSPRFKFIDFHMTDSHNERFLHEPVINLVSRDFLVSNPFPDYFDIVSVSNNSRRKNLLDLLKIIVLAKQKAPDLTACLLINTPSKKFRKNSRSSDVKFLDYYFKQSRKFRDDVVLLRLSDELGQEGVSVRFVNWLMSKSRIFLFCSMKEGVAKVVQEAFEAGCFILGNKRLEGDTYSRVAKNKLYLFNDIDDASSKIIDLVKCNQDTPRCLDYRADSQRILSYEISKILGEEFIFNYNGDLSQILPGLETDDFFKLSTKAPFDGGNLARSLKLMKKLKELR